MHTFEQEQTRQWQQDRVEALLLWGVLPWLVKALVVMARRAGGVSFCGLGVSCLFVFREFRRRRFVGTFNLDNNIH